jgi:RNA polymerase subunit RPABC4/transcription elongation factor Spt4
MGATLEQSGTPNATTTATGKAIMNTCPSCGASVPDVAKFCGNCGKEIYMPLLIVCRVCKRKMDPNDKFCPSCGFGKIDMGPSSSSPPIPVYMLPSEVPQQNKNQPPDLLYSSLSQIKSYSSGVKCRKCGRDLKTRRGRCESCGNKVAINRRYDYLAFFVTGGDPVDTGRLFRLHGGRVHVRHHRKSLRYLGGHSGNEKEAL